MIYKYIQYNIMEEQLTILVQKCHLCQKLYDINLLNKKECKYCSYYMKNKKKIRQFIDKYFIITNDENDILTLKDIIDIFYIYYEVYTKDTDIIIFKNYYLLIYELINKFRNNTNCINNIYDTKKNLYTSEIPSDILVLYNFKNDLNGININYIKFNYPIEKMKCNWCDKIYYKYDFYNNEKKNYYIRCSNCRIKK